MQWLDTVQFFVLLFRSDQEVFRWLFLPKSSTFIHILSCLTGKVRRSDLGKSSPTGLSKARSRIWTSMTSRHLVNRLQMLEHAFGVGPGRLELSPEEVREGFASFYYDLTAATSEAQLGAILKLVPVSQLVMGLDFPLMPKSTFAPAIADIGRYPAFNKADLQNLSHGNAGRLYPSLKARIEQASAHNGS